MYLQLSIWISFHISSLSVSSRSFWTLCTDLLFIGIPKIFEQFSPLQLETYSWKYITRLPHCCSENQIFRPLSMKSWGIPPLNLNRKCRSLQWGKQQHSAILQCNTRFASRRLNYTRSASKMFLKCLSPNRPWRFCTSTISGTPEIEVLTNWKLHEL